MTITDNAVKQLRTMLAGRADADRAGLRLFIERGGCSGLQYGMQFEQPRTGDEIVERDGVRVFVESESVPHLRHSARLFVATVGLADRRRSPSWLL